MGRKTKKKRKKIMDKIKQEWTGYASGAAGGSSGWFPEIRHESSAKASKKKKQSVSSREDESLGMRTGPESTKKQSMKDRRDESYGK